MDKPTEWILKKCVDSLFAAGKYSMEKLSKSICDEENRPAVDEFIREPTQTILVISTPGADRVTCTLTFPQGINKKVICFIKPDSIKETLKEEEMDEFVLATEINSQASLDNLSLMAEEIFFPLLSNPANRAGWSGPTSKEVMLKFSNFLSNLTMAVGQARGQTLLPYPPPEAFDEDNLPEKERVHLLETSVVQWANRIQAVLATDPDAALKDGSNPDPESEIQFWEAKGKNLESLHEQLNSAKMKSVLETLSEMQSPFSAQFEKLTKDVADAGAEAKDNNKYLKTLDRYFGAINASLDFATLPENYLPLLHTMLLVWQHSKTYNNQQRLACLIQELCNSLINNASNFVNGEAIFRFIEDESVGEAVQLLASTLDIIGQFKTMFRVYQEKAAKVLPEGAWDVPDELLFGRLDLFLERCHDIQEFTSIVVEFTKLEKISLGGTKGQELTDTLQGVFRDFNSAVHTFQHVPYDIMDVSVVRFDEDFYRFRCNIKELEVRLSAIIISSFDDQATIQAKFHLLDAFEGLVERPSIKDELDKRTGVLLSSYMDDLTTVQNMFHQHKDSPRIDNNMPPIAGALQWCRGLLERIKAPMEDLRHFMGHSDREEIKDIEKIYESLTIKLQKFESEHIAEWTREIDQTSQNNLMKSLLKRDKETRRLGVNFDMALVRLLREVKYFLNPLALEVPPNALAIFSKAKMYRVQIGNLEMIVHMYNDMMDTLHMVERPLVEKEMAHIDETLEKGIAELNWKSPEIDVFLKEAMETVKSVFQTVKIMKDNFATIKKIMSEYAKVPLADRKNKPQSPADFEDHLKKLWATRHTVISEHQETVTKLLTETNQALKVNKGSPIWRAYVEYVQDHVRDGLAFTIVNSIRFICDQLDQASIEKNDLPPLLEIKLGLYANDVLFNAEDGVSGLDEKAPRKSRRDVWQIVNDWVEGFFEIGNIMTRMDGSHYVGDLKKNEGIVRFINTLKKHLDWNQKECESYRQEYIKFEFLWKTDRNTEFYKFLQNAVNPPKAGEDEGTEEPKEGEEKKEKKKTDMPDILPLAKFEEKIQFYKDLQAEVAEKKSPVQIGWLKINSSVIKSALTTWVSRWVETYTSFLYNDVARKLSQMENLITTVDEGLQREVKPGDSEALKAVLGHIHQVRSQEKMGAKMFAPLRECVALLKKHDRNLEDYELKLLADMPIKWDTTVNQVYKIKEKVNSLQNTEVENIKEKVEQFDQGLLKFRELYKKEAPFTYEYGVNAAYETINIWHGKIHAMETEASKLVDLEEVFELNVSKHQEIKANRLENKQLKQMWDMISLTKHSFNDWKKTLWDDIDSDALIAKCKNLQKQTSLMPKDIRGWKVFIGLQDEIKNLMTVLPLVSLLHSPCMMERHWRELKQSTGKDFDKDNDFSLADLLALELHNYVPIVEYIVELANKENKISGQLEKIEETWSGLELEFGEHQKKGEAVPIIIQTEEILTNLEENMASLQSMQGQGKYVEFFLDQVNHWQKTLGTTEQVITDWLEVMQGWISLETIFLGSKDIRVQLPEDSKRFDGIDEEFRKLMNAGVADPNVIQACCVKGRDEVLKKLKTGLSQCEKSLFQYLETKRKAFPRFYFLANAALLDILSNGYDPQSVQKHLGGCFDNIARLEYDKDPDNEGKFLRTATGMYSKEGYEFVPWTEKFNAEGPVEDWLNDLVIHMQEQLKDNLSRAKFTADHWEIEKPRNQWLYDYPAQIALTASQIIWTEEVNATFETFADGNEQAMKDYTKTCTNRVEQLIQLVLGNLEKCDRIKIITLITVDVHNRDVVQQLVDEKIMEGNQFTWQKQMRYEYRSEERETLVRVADASFYYQFEYVGNTGRLVITPLTDRCYITLTQAMRLIMGGAPAGPAGTGKTETTKDLGRAIGLPVYVFNCSEQMNVQSMGAVFKGLAQTGAWGCFDEFNRIPIEVLSVVATQVASILDAIRADLKEFNFQGEMIGLRKTVGMFITMNPGYAGRTELPENLKALFRSCAMVVPDITLICENMLMSEGFFGARRLALKFTTLYGLSKELLSKQMHYDWGLRATKAVLRVAGGLKRGEPEVDEDRILMRALRDFNMPKLVDEDKPIFRQLCDDLFPGLGNTKRKFDNNLHDNIRKMTLEHKLQAEEMFMLKCIELAELLVIRHSIFIIGPPGCGKSEIWKTLARTFNHMGEKTVFETLNPKAIRNNELYGWLTKTDWHDGILSTIMRNMSNCVHPYNETQKKKWIVLDGDIDPNWIESLNTVMDDNKMLTLVSNERIPVTDSMSLLFEISNLDNATPATVSRAGIIFINAKDVGYKPFLDSWIEARENEQEKSSLLALFNKYTTPENLQEIRTAFKRAVTQSEMNMFKTMCFLLEGLLSRAHATKAEAQRKGTYKQLDAAAEKEMFEANFVFAAIWAFGGGVMVDKLVDYRKEFSEWWKRVFTTIKFPKDGQVFDYYPDAETGSLHHWSDITAAFDPPDDAHLVTKVFVPTQETACTNFLLDMFVQNRKHVMVVGGAGTGKTATVGKYLRSMDERFMFCTINLNNYTDAKKLQQIMEGPIDKRSGRIYGPPGTKKLIYFIDDLNMPYVDLYGTQSPSALIRQQMDYTTWFDTTKLEKKEIHDVQYVAAMNPTSGSFVVDPRLQGQFAVLAAQMPGNDTLKFIYQTVLNHHVSKFGQDVKDMAEPLVEATMALHEAVTSRFLPSTRKFHYQFNLRDMSNIFQGLCMSQGKYSTPASLFNLWLHESSRVFSDRLFEEDLPDYEALLFSKAEKHLKDFQAKAKTADGAEPPPRVWASFANVEYYNQVKSMSELRNVLDGKLEGHNESNAAMDLELFDDAMRHVSRICRIIENPRGNAMLVGVGGSGKQSLARLASFICGYDVFQITVTASYGMADLKADMMELYMKAGVKNIPVSFLLTDTQIGDHEWLVYVNDLLSSGFIPDLFLAEDLDGIYSSMRSDAKALGIPDTREAMNDFFIDRTRSNLHMVLCFSPVGDNFRICCRKFPALINCTAIDWFHPWPKDALESVALRFLEDVELNSDEERKQLSKHMAMVHISVNTASERFLRLERRFNYTTPKSFLELIGFYKGLLAKKRGLLDKAIGRLEKGIDTLKNTGSAVDLLKANLTETLVRVAEKSKSVTELIAKMGVELKKVDEQQAVAKIEADKAKTVSDVANKISAECKKELDAALPVMEAAKTAVDCLNKASLGTLKSFSTPPPAAVTVTTATMWLMGAKGKKDWAGAKTMMKDIGKFLEALKGYDATNIPDEVLVKVRPILADEHFNVDAMMGVSEAAANLCGWCINIVAYNEIYKNVAPKIAAQTKAQEEFQVAQGNLREVEDQVAKLQKKLKEVTDSLKEATDEKVAVENEAAACQDRLGLAKRLVDGLADENTRWALGVEKFKASGATMVGDVMLSAAFVSYVGAFNQTYRTQLWKEQWIPDLEERKIIISEGVDPLLVLAGESDFAKWKNEGLAADRSSLENGAIITQCSRWPLLIDPQLQGIKWIRSRVKDLKIIQLNQKRWLNAIVEAVSNGQTILIEGVGEDLDATLNPVLSRSIITRGGMKVIQVGAEEVSYDDNFRLFLQTKLTNPHYKPETSAQCTLVNFIVTEEGLEDQLLAFVVNKEKPELEEKRTALVRAINDYKVSLTDLENELLERLANAPDDILSDIALIEGLEKTKLASVEIEQKVEFATKQEISINIARNEFRLVAAEGSWIYFLLIELCAIDHMYQYSLDAFTTFFMKAMTKAAKSDETAKRVLNLKESIRIVTFTWVNRGLFEKHKLIFSSMLTFKLMSRNALAAKLDTKYFEYLVRAPKLPVAEKPLDWLPAPNWFAIQALCKLDGFQKLASDMEASPNRFKEWFNKGRPEDTPLPLDWRKLDDSNPFLKLLVVRAMRPDRMTTAMTNYIEKTLPHGKSYTECDAGKSFLDVLSMSMEDSTTVNPIFFILSAGADPVQSLETIAKKQGYFMEKYHRVALGEGQDIVAMAKLELGHKEGHWCVLENIHLMPTWCRELEKKLDDFAVEGSHPDFRIFLSAEPSDEIPIGLLERSIKLTNEPPTGMKQNLQRAFATFDKEEFEFKDVKVKNILFGLCHFHAIIVERKKFGPQGWNAKYPFNTGDLMNSSTVLTNYVEMSNDKIPWKDLRYIFGEILYGGHITDDWDRLLCNTYLEHFLKEELLDEMELYPFNESFPEEHFRTPPVLAYDQYFEYIDSEMPGESPCAFGMHPNAEISVKTTESEELFRYILELQPRSGGGEEGEDASPQARVQQALTDIVERVKGIKFSIDDISTAVVDDRGPYQNVFIQECDRMNILVAEIQRTLKELELGLSGELQMSERMETLQSSIFVGRVPDNWTKLAYPSLRPLGAWLDNLVERAAQLQGWCEEPVNIPIVTSINYMFNPQSFLTAIMQITAQKQKMELDKLVVLTDVTRKTVETTESRAREGAYVSGLYLEGARWNWTTGLLEECEAREMFCELPVVCCRAILSDKQEKTGVYMCPAYKTQARGQHYVFTASLRTKMPPAKWVLTGTCLLLEAPNN